MHYSPDHSFLTDNFVADSLFSDILYWDQAVIMHTNFKEDYKDENYPYVVM